MLCTFCQSTRHNRDVCPILSNNYSINDQLYDLKHDLQLQLNVLKTLQEKLNNMQLNEQRHLAETRTIETQTQISAIGETHQVGEEEEEEEEEKTIENEVS
jgi:hypothetical protein